MSQISVSVVESLVAGFESRISQLNKELDEKMSYIGEVALNTDIVLNALISKMVELKLVSEDQIKQAIASLTQQLTAKQQIDSKETVQ